MGALFWAFGICPLAGQPTLSRDLPPQALVDAIFPHGTEPPPLVLALKRSEDPKPDPLCGLASAELTENRGPHTRTYNILIKAPDGDPPNPSEVFLRVSRFTVDADGSSRAYHPLDPLGLCEPGKSNACAIDELSSADVQLFRGTQEIDPHASDAERADYLTTWAKAWALITKDLRASLNHQTDARIPEPYALYYLKADDLAVVFKTSIIPFRNGAPCMRGPKLSDPGYFVASTSFTKTKVTPENVCDPSHYIDSTKVPFVVIPGNTFGQVNTGDLAIGFAKSTSGDRIVYGIVGDKGPFYKTSEASIAFNSKMLGRNEPLKNAADQDNIDFVVGTHDISSMGVLVLGGTKAALKGDYSAENIAMTGSRLLRAWGGKQKSTERIAACLNAAPLNSWK